MCQYSIETEAPWRTFISLKYGTEVGGWFSKEALVFGKKLSRTQLKLNCSFVVGKGDNEILGGHLVQ